MLQDITLQKELLQRHLLSFVRLALQTKVPMGAITSSMLQNSKCNLILVLDILLLTRVGSLSKKKKQKGKILHASLLYALSHDSLHFAIILLTPSATKTIILGSPSHSPRFGAKKGKLLFTVTIHLSLFTGTIHCYCSLRNFAYLRGAVPYI